MAVVVTALLSVVFFVFGLVPAPPQAEGVPDVVSHGLGYAGLGFVATVAAGVLGLVPAVGWGWAYAVAHGGMLEVLQSLVPSRHAQWRDLVADALGAGLGAALAATRRRPR